MKIRKIKKFDRVAASLVIWSNAFCSLNVCSLREEKNVIQLCFNHLHMYIIWTFKCTARQFLVFNTLTGTQFLLSFLFRRVVYFIKNMLTHESSSSLSSSSLTLCMNVAKQEMFIRYTTQETRKKSPSFRNVLLSTNTISSERAQKNKNS